MRKILFATAFSGIVFLALPPAELTRMEAWTVITYLFWSGRAIAWWAEGQLEQWRERKCATSHKERRRSA